MAPIPSTHGVVTVGHIPGAAVRFSGSTDAVLSSRSCCLSNNRRSTDAKAVRAAVASATPGTTKSGRRNAQHHDTHKEQLGNDLLEFLNSSGDVSELVGASAGKENA